MERGSYKNIFVKEIKEREKVEGVFLVSKKETALSKNGNLYLILRLMDRTGEIEGRVWEEAESLAKGFDKDDFVSVKGWAVPFQGGIQINISAIERFPEDKVSLHDFLPSSDRDPEEMMRELVGLIRSMEDPYLRRLLTLFVEDREISRLLKMAPAAKNMHHAYLGGLLEHTLSLSRLILDVSRHYRNMNRDLLLTGAVLHDIGKIYELSYEKTFDYTDEGRLLGHIVKGVEMVEKKASMIPGFPEELKMLVKHMILSHHGHLEYGSPKRPKIPEAIMLYYLDDMDAKVQSVQRLIEEEREKDSNWTSYHRLYQRQIYKGQPRERTKETTPTGGAQEKELDLFSTLKD